ncbi:hypothetical protein M3Y97_00758500 [Aphelenchoides bicaudatus]|nr:hypothetical protein M3Y97_00758500 [Aphelenchoides bicaudatus]
MKTEMNGRCTEIRISPSFSAPKIIMNSLDETEPLEQSPDDLNNNACSSAENLSLERGILETQRLSPPLMPSQPRPHSNSVCTSLLLTPDTTKRAQLHRASDSHLMGERFRQHHERRPSQRRTSILEQDLYWKANEARHRSNLWTTPLASYIFVFISVMLTFSIVFAVGYLISSMTYRGPNPRGMPLGLNNFNATNPLAPTANSVQNMVYNLSVDQRPNSRLLFLPTNVQI